MFVYLFKKALKDLITQSAWNFLDLSLFPPVSDPRKNGIILWLARWLLTAGHLGQWYLQFEELCNLACLPRKQHSDKQMLNYPSLF